MPPFGSRLAALAAGVAVPILAGLIVASAAAASPTVRFSFTGTEKTYTVPPGVTALQLTIH